MEMKLIGKPRRRVVNENAIKFLIGASAIALPVIELCLALFSDRSLESISASYAVDPWPRNYLVGFLFAMGAFMLTYNGWRELESWLARIGAVAAFVVALVPGRYADGKFLIPGWPPQVHAVATGVLFAVLIGFCFVFIKRARDKKYPEARRRIKLYVVCGSLMVVSAGLLVFNATSKPSIPWLLLAGEFLGLLSFGFAWLTAAKFIFATDKERLKPWVVRRDVNKKITSIDILVSAEADHPTPQQEPQPAHPVQAPA